MPRRLRIEFEDAIYHVMARGNARQKIVRDDADRRRLTGGLEQAAVRYGWQVLCYVIMGNHLEATALSRRHDPHLARAVAAWLCRRHTEASLRELAEWLGLSRADSVPNLTRRLVARLRASPRLAGDLAEIMSQASGPAESRRPAKRVQTQASGRSGRTKTKTKS